MFCRKKELNDGKHGQGTHSAKKGADSSAVNSQNTPKSLKFIRPIDPIGPKIWDILKKGLYWVSVIRARTKD